MRFVMHLFHAALVAAAVTQANVSLADCPGGQCPGVVPVLPGNGPALASPDELAIDSRAIVRIVNSSGGSRCAGTGTLVDVDGERGLVVTCAHLFRDGAGTVNVTFPNRQAFSAALLKTDTAADLAALEIAAPAVAPVAIAPRYPLRGDPLVSCGYGSDGRLWCNRGQALGYVSAAGGQGSEVLELSGAARLGDSGGPVLDRNQQLVAVLFGTNGRVVDGTYCGRVRRFLSGLSPRFRTQPTKPASPPPVVASPPVVEAPPVGAQPNTGAAALGDKLAKLETLIAKLNEIWSALASKLDQLATAVPPSAAGSGSSGGDSPATNSPAPSANTPPADPIESVAEPWISAKLTALLVSLGVPGGVAGAAAGMAVWLVMRRAKAQLQAQLDGIQATGGTSAAGGQQTPTSADPSVVERHHNQYVPYEIGALDKAWAAAHAHVGEKYPGAVPYLKMVEGVKDQLLSGNKDIQ